MVTVLQMIALALAGGVFFYLALLSLLALLTRKHKSLAATRLRTFAVVVPAHNEEHTITRTLRSLKHFDYSQALVDTVVVADNCSDGTADAARRMGALVLEREDAEKRGKGFALRWCFDELLHSERKYDAMVVIDADSRVSRNFLTVMNYYLDKGSAAVQANDVPEPQPEAWSAEVVRIGMTLYNYVRPLGRRRLGCSAGLRGNGMCFTAETLRIVPWEAYSLTEDLEYGLELLKNGIVVTFAPEASVLATMPANVKNAASQRARWEAGRFPVVKRYAPILLNAALHRRSFRFLDALIDLTIPPFVNLFAVAVVFSVMSGFLQLVTVGSQPWILGGWMLVLFLGISHVILGLLAANADRDLFRALLFIPRFALWKILLYRRMIASGSQKEWIRTAREHPPSVIQHR